MQNILKRAKSFADNGFYVFPTYKSKRSNFSKPYGWTGASVVDASKAHLAISPTTDSSEIDLWPEKIKAYKSSLSGFAILGSGIVIIDIDVKDDKPGLQSLEKLKKLFSLPEPSIITKTKSGGYHLFYAKPKKYENSRIKTIANITIDKVEYTGVDIRGDGGCVIGPEIIGGSWVADKYVLIKGEPGDELSVLPEDFCKLLISNNFSKVVSDSPLTTDYSELSNLSDQLTASFDTAIDELNELTNSMVESVSDISAEELAKQGIMPETVPKGQRNNIIFLYVSALKNRGYSRADTAKLANILLSERCEQTDDIKKQIDLEDILNRAYNINRANPYDVARYIMENDLYKIVMKGGLWYFTTARHEFFPHAEFISSGGLVGILAPYSAKIQIGDDKPKLINPAQVINDRFKNETFVAGVGFFGIDKKIITYRNKNFVNIYNPPDFSARRNKTVESEFITLVSRLFGSRDSEFFQLAMDFLAWNIQHPNKKCVITPFLISKVRGVGKSLLFSLLQGALGTSKFGTPQGRISRIDDISNRFFDPTNCVLNLFDEVQFDYHRNIKQESVSFWRNLKTFITAEELPVEEKFKPTVVKPNFANFLLAGNSGNNFPVEEFDRRLWVVDNETEEMPLGLCDTLYAASKSKVTNPEFAEEVFGAIRVYLKSWKIEHDLTIARAPDTALKEMMFRDSKSDLDLWFMDYFSDESNLFVKHPFITVNMIYYILETEDVPENWKKEKYSIFRRLSRGGVISAVKTLGNNKVTYQLKNAENIDTNGRIETSKSVLVYSTRSFNDEDRQNIRVYIQEHVDQLKSMRKTRLSVL